MSDPPARIPGALNIEAPELQSSDIISIGTRGPRSAQTTLGNIEGYLSSNNTPSSNEQLSALSTEVERVVVRTGFSERGDIPPLEFISQKGTCAINGMANDGGACVDAEDGGSWRAILPAVPDIRFWGAGTEDDSTQFIQRAVDYGGPLAVPAAEFNCGSIVATKPVGLFGQGNKTSIFRTTEIEYVANTKMFDFQTDNWTLCGIHLELGGDGIGGTGEYLPGLVGWPDYGVFATGRSGINVIRCTSDKGQNVLYFDECTDGLVQGNTFERALRWHYYWEGGARWLIEGNQSYWANYDGYKWGADSAGGATPATPTDIDFIGNIAADVGRDGVDMAVDGCENVNISGNVFSRFKAYGVECKKSGVNGSTAPMRNVAVNGNTFEHSTVSTFTVAMRTEDGSAGAYEGLEVNSNIVSGVDRDVNLGIWVGGANKGSVKSNDITTVTDGVVLTQCGETTVGLNDIRDAVRPIHMFSGNPGTANVLVANTLRAVGSAAIYIQTGVETVVSGNSLYVDAGQLPIYDENTDGASQALRTRYGINYEVIDGVETTRSHTSLMIGVDAAATKALLAANSLSFNRAGNFSYIEQLGIGGALRARLSSVTPGDTTVWEAYATGLFRIYGNLQIPSNLAEPPTEASFNSLYSIGTDTFIKYGTGLVRKITTETP